MCRWLDGILQFQLIQKNYHKLELRLLCYEGYDKFERFGEAKKQLLGMLRNMAIENVDIELSEELPKTNQVIIVCIDGINTPTINSIFIGKAPVQNEPELVVGTILFLIGTVKNLSFFSLRSSLAYPSPALSSLGCFLYILRLL